MAESNVENDLNLPRERRMTERGYEYVEALNLKKLKSSLSDWRKHSNKLTVLLTDEPNTSVLRTERSLLERSFIETSTVFNLLQEMGSEQVLEFSQEFENLEKENHVLMNKIAACISELEADKFESKSVNSPRSYRSCSSKSSGKSVRSKHSDKAMKAATLKAQLKYFDIERKSKAEFDKITLMKKYEIANAQLGVLDEAKRSLSHDDNDIFGAGLRDNLFDLDGLQGEGETKTQVHTPSQIPSNPDVKPKAFYCPPIRTETSSFPDLKQLGLPSFHTSLSPDAEPFISKKLVGPPQSQTLHSSGMTKINDTEDALGNSSVSANPIGPDNRIEQGLIELAKTLVDQVILSRLPPPEPSVFFGDPLQYPSWKTAFHTLIDPRNIPNAERIHYLKRYLGGQVRQVVENYFLLSNDSAYEDAKKLLDQRYGDPFVIANAFRNKLDDWPKIIPKDGIGLRKFSDFLIQCQAAMKTTDSLHVLNDERENKKILAKLPDWLVARWARSVNQWREEHNKFPPFDTFCVFIAKEAKIATDPITSFQSLRPDISVGSKVGGDKSVSKRFPGSHVHFVDSKDKPTSSQNLQLNVDRNLRFYCHKPHSIHNCESFLAEPLARRKLFAKEKKLCFACLHSGHVSKQCQFRKRCHICHKLHPTALHGDVRDSNSSAKNVSENSPSGDKDKEPKSSHSGVALMNLSGSGCKSSMVVPVYVSHVSSPGEEKLIYALLDTQSDTTFVLENTCRSLGVVGSQVSMFLTTMFAENQIITREKVKGLMVRGYDSSLKLPLPDAFTRNIIPANRAHIPTHSMAKMWPHLDRISEKLMPLGDFEIGLLIGYNCSRALLPRDVITPVGEGPYALKTDLGWSIVGVVTPDCQKIIDDESVAVSHRVMTCVVPQCLSSLKSDESCADQVLISFPSKVKEIVNPGEMIKMMDVQFSDNSNFNRALSLEDTRFLALMKEGIHKTNGQYEMPLPFKEHKPDLPNNKVLAVHRLECLKRRFSRNKEYCSDYGAFMQEAISKGYAELVPKEEIKTHPVWYIPHHGIYHPKKPGKIRVVFDCSAKFKGTCLNDHLLQGPDLTNSLVGVLCRFRKEKIAIMCDIEKMFFQFKVNPDDRDYLRFLWWNTDDHSCEPSEYRMTVHLFGAVSSPACSNFGLKQLASDNEVEFGSDVAEFLRNNFYVDDGLHCLPSVEAGINLVKRSKELCMKGGIRLHKFVSNSKAVLEQISCEDRAKVLEGVDLAHDSLPVERALGVQWCIESDSFQFRIVLQDKPLTRRGVLATLSSVYDPLGFISPVILVGRQILQRMCAISTDWDSPLPDEIRSQWEKWRNDLPELESFRIRRCVKPDDFGDIVSAELHNFSDASTTGYGQCSYLRLVDNNSKISCSLIMSKSWVTPLKPITIPRLELQAALVSVKVSVLLQHELKYENLTSWYWTDSKVVLGNVSNDSRRFHVFVANRVQQIREHTQPNQWRYIDTKVNPADIASRGCSAKELLCMPAWRDGPDVLWQISQPVVCTADQILVSPEDKELKKVQNLATHVECVPFQSLLSRLAYFSDWHRAKRAVAVCLNFIDKLRTGMIKRPSVTLSHEELQSRILSRYEPVTVSDLQRAELVIVRSVQSSAFNDEIATLQSIQELDTCKDRNSVKQRMKVLKSSSNLYKLDAFLDENLLIRVGGRLCRAEFMDIKVKHPVILPRKSHVSDLVIQYFHKRVEHQGRGITTNEIRANGFWIVAGSSAISLYISKCVLCRRLRYKTHGQRMADLPIDRLSADAPFTYSGVHFFGPWVIKEGRRECKRYGVVFTCLPCRAIHLEPLAL